MTRREIEACVKKWQKRLHLDHWEITIDLDEPPESEGAQMEIDKAWNYDIARLKVAPNWREWTRRCVHLNGPGAIVVRSLDRIVVHELLHLTTREMDFATPCRLTEDQMHRDVEKLAIESYQHALEGVVERLARVICEAYGEA